MIGKHCFDNWSGVELAKLTSIMTLKCVSIDVHYAFLCFSWLNQEWSAYLKYAFLSGWINMKHKVGNEERLFNMLLAWQITLVPISVTGDRQAFFVRINCHCHVVSAGNRYMICEKHLPV